MSRIEVESEVTGSVWKIEVAPGDQVAAGTTLMILESMKMEIPVEAPVAGRVVSIAVAAEDAVTEDQCLAVLESD